jgi:hypothetical protein
MEESGVRCDSLKWPCLDPHHWNSSPLDRGAYQLSNLLTLMRFPSMQKSPIPGNYKYASVRQFWRPKTAGPFWPSPFHKRVLPSPACCEPTTTIIRQSAVKKKDKRHPEAGVKALFSIQRAGNLNIIILLLFLTNNALSINIIWVSPNLEATKCRNRRILLHSARASPFLCFRVHSSPTTIAWTAQYAVLNLRIGMGADLRQCRMARPKKYWALFSPCCDTIHFRNN